MPNYIGTKRKTPGSFTDLGVLFGPLQRINHSQGHAAGDAARCALTNVCRSEVRHVDYFSQFGNGEFAALLPDTTKAFTDGINQKSIVARAAASS